ncbi:MAG: hypothetical protein LBD66_01360, partial [Holosporales bacterium]|nr:hypothetical protein [Holosporales bacterium]
EENAFERSYERLELSLESVGYKHRKLLMDLISKTCVNIPDRVAFQILETETQKYFSQQRVRNL